MKRSLLTGFLFLPLGTSVHIWFSGQLEDVKVRRTRLASLTFSSTCTYR